MAKKTSPRRGLPLRLVSRRFGGELLQPLFAHLRIRKEPSDKGQIGQLRAEVRIAGKKQLLHLVKMVKQLFVRPGPVMPPGPLG